MMGRVSRHWIETTAGTYISTGGWPQARTPIYGTLLTPRVKDGAARKNKNMELQRGVHSVVGEGNVGSRMAARIWRLGPCNAIVFGCREGVAGRRREERYSGRAKESL
jgi:hypothetical protein